MKYNVFGVGNALVDIQARVSDSLVEQLGFTKGVMTLVDEGTQLRVLSALKDYQWHRCAGGSAANTVMGIVDFGGRAAYAGKVADDELGQFFLSDMRHMGVAIDVPPQAGLSGSCVVLITPDAQRTMLTHLGVSAQLSPRDISPTAIAEAEYLYVEGYLFLQESTRQAALKAITMARELQVKVALTLSDPFVVSACRELFWELIEGPVDLLFCNIEEARSLTGKIDPLDCAHQIHRHATDLALTLGANGSLLIHGGQVTPIEGVEVTAIDTTGAGDMYAAGILYGLTHGLSWRQAGHLASHAAARIVGQLGARLARRFTPQEIQDLLR
ncbi:MAG: adenosine kinase [Planctomycetaceae bacterium]|nr:MAG: adenosine kinase [Planctomycetaceae bacterium]